MRLLCDCDVIAMLLLCAAELGDVVAATAVAVAVVACWCTAVCMRLCWRASVAGCVRTIVRLLG